jgi:hypothetical protein
MSGMRTPNNACNNVQLIVLLLCIFFTMMGELISLFVYGINRSESHTRDRWKSIVKSKCAHIIGSGILFSLLIQGVVDETNISISLLQSSVGFCSYSITLTQYLNRVPGTYITKDTTSRVIHCCFYILSMTGNAFLCLYTLMGWSYIDKILYAHVNELLFCVWSVMALGYGLICLWVERTRHPIPCRMVNYCGTITRPVARLTLFVTWCILQIMVLIMAVASIFTPFPDRISILLYIPYLIIAQWVIHYAHDRLDYYVYERPVKVNALEIVWYV